MTSWFLRASLALSAAVLLAACGTPTVVRYDYGEGADLRQRKLAVFLDGSASNYETRTNVRRLFELVANQERPDIAAYYQEGVGGLTRRLTSSPLSPGSLLGTGIDEDVRQAYRFLAENYRAGGEPGRRADEADEVYLFGFSRGAYTARVLAGMMDLFGGVPDLTKGREQGPRLDADAREELVEKFYQVYKTHGEACGRQGDEQACAKATARVAKLKRRTRPVRIHSLGIWDTVRSLGLETLDCAVRRGNDPNKNDHPFHRDKLYGNVERAFHALALDERRRCYYPLLLRPANGAPAPRVLEETWFAGDHSGISGGHADDRQLSGVTLNWMIDRLAGSGLLPEGMSGYMHQNAMGAVVDQTDGVFKVLGKRRRDRAFADVPPGAKPKLHVSVVQRLLRSRRCPGARVPYAPSPIMSYLNGTELNEATLHDRFTIVGVPPESCRGTSCDCLAAQK